MNHRNHPLVQASRKRSGAGSRHGLSIAALLAVIVLMSGCMVGPNYHRPPAPATPEFKEAAGWRPAQPSDQATPAIRAQWWSLFGDPKLNALEAQVAPANQSVKAALAQYEQARAMVQYQRANLFPFLSAGVSSSRQRGSENRATYFKGFPNQYNDFSLPLDVSWEPDLWGRVRRTVRAARANAQSTAADLANLQLSLQAELAVDYFTLRGLDEQKRILDETVAAYAESLHLNQQLRDAGLASDLEVAQAETQLKAAEAEDQDVAVARAQNEHAIAVLTGRPPAQLTIPPSPCPCKPPAIPAGLPSQLLERRPDVAAAERQMAAANEQIGIARSAYYPTFTIGGIGGVESARPGNWFTGPSTFWSFGLSAADTLVDWGQRHALNTQAQANYNGTVASYRQTVLTAYQEVEDNLAAMRILQGESATQQQTIQAARQQEAIAMKRFREGLDSYINVIQAQDVVLSSQLTESTIDTRRMTASVLLIKALGGGWTTQQLPAD